MIVPLLMSLSLAGVGPTGDGMWGNVGFGMYPTGSEKVAPNGLEYKPMFRIVADFNIGSRDLYLFSNSAYYTEKPQPGVTTNKSQGSLDFTKRQYDFSIGGAYGLTRNTELRLWAYSQSNINRGTDLNKPSGYKDGFTGELRYFFEEDNTLNYAGVGYYFTKELVDTNGQAYTPSFLGEVKFSTLLGYGIHASTSAVILGERAHGFKEVNTQIGLTYRMLGASKTTAYLYVENDFGRQGDTQRRVLLEFRRSFQGN